LGLPHTNVVLVIVLLGFGNGTIRLPKVMCICGGFSFKRPRPLRSKSEVLGSHRACSLPWTSALGRSQPPRVSLVPIHMPLLPAHHTPGVQDCELPLTSETHHTCPCMPTVHSSSAPADVSASLDAPKYNNLARRLAFPVSRRGRAGPPAAVMPQQLIASTNPKKTDHEKTQKLVHLLVFSHSWPAFLPFLSYHVHGYSFISVHIRAQIDHTACGCLVLVCLVFCGGLAACGLGLGGQQRQEAAVDSVVCGSCVVQVRSPLRDSLNSVAPGSNDRARGHRAERRVVWHCRLCRVVRRHVDS